MSQPWQLLDSTGKSIARFESEDGCTAEARRQNGPGGRFGSFTCQNSVISEQITWLQVASEGAWFTVTKPRSVRYGAKTSYVTKALDAGTYSCSNNFFGDPIYGVAKGCDAAADAPSAGVPGPLPVMSISMPLYNETRLPAPNVNPSQVYAVERVAPTIEQPAGGGNPGDSGEFRTTASWSHFAFDDPIVYPGQPGKSHLHTFFGNTETSAASTYETLMACKGSTARGGLANCTAYWAPALIDTTTGVPLTPLSITVYYKTGYAGVRAKDVQVMPQGLRMVAGDPTNKGEMPPGNPGNPTSWSCDTGNGNSGPWQRIPPTCIAGAGLQMNVVFPQCWDGKNLDSPDHKSHMAYANGGAYITQAQLEQQRASTGKDLQWYQSLTPTAGCPATHPVPLPVVTYGVWYQVPADRPERIERDWRLSSDAYDTSLPGGYSSHADWFGAWKRDVIEAWTKNCEQAGKDCHSHLLGDGRQIY